MPPNSPASAPDTNGGWGGLAIVKRPCAARPPKIEPITELMSNTEGMAAGPPPGKPAPAPAEIVKWRTADAAKIAKKDAITETKAGSAMICPNRTPNTAPLANPTSDKNASRYAACGTSC